LKFNKKLFMNLTMLYDFMQVLNSIRSSLPRRTYFTKHILFTTIYLLQERKFNHKKIYEQELNMGQFCTSH
jgi:hypothetical protein